MQAFIPNTGRGVQGATSHCLGQNFAKMFDITFENEKGEKAMIWQNSWAYSTRTVTSLAFIFMVESLFQIPVYFILDISHSWHGPNAIFWIMDHSSKHIGIYIFCDLI